MLRKVERWSTLSNKFWLCCSFFINLTTCHATNVAILDPRQANQSISALHFFNPQQMFLLRDKLSAQGEKRETSTKTCNETMLRDNLRVFVSPISPPLVFTGLRRGRLLVLVTQCATHAMGEKRLFFCCCNCYCSLV